MDIGILGGTFDPVHLGHLMVAEEARKRLGFGRVLFIPSGQPWLKIDRVITPAVHRVEMVRLAIDANPYFELSTIEVDRPGPSYALDTLAFLQSQLDNETRLFFILGWDSLTSLQYWKQPAELIKICQLLAVPRLDSSPPDLKALDAAVPGLRQRTILLDMPRINVSSSDIRRRVMQGLSIRYLVPDAVARYIAEHSLYVN